MFGERHRPDGTIDYPVGGGASIVNALVRGLRKHGGRLLLRAHVDEILVEHGRAVGVRLRPAPTREGYASSDDEQGIWNTHVSDDGVVAPDGVIAARCAVISNASIWDTAKLLPKAVTAAVAGRLGQQPADAGSGGFKERARTTAMTGSFMHLHLGLDAAGLPEDLECHHLVVNDWDAGIDAPQNVVIISIPSVFDPDLAPPGKHVAHVYTAGNEPYDLWAGMDRKSSEYAVLKEERSQVLWKALERVIPDCRVRAEVALVGTPLTHERYVRRAAGTYGPAVKAGAASWPGPRGELPGLLHCGDSIMPGIGVPAVAASGMMAANALLSVGQHWRQLDCIDAAAGSSVA